MAYTLIHQAALHCQTTCCFTSSLFHDALSSEGYSQRIKTSLFHSTTFNLLELQDVSARFIDLLQGVTCSIVSTWNYTICLQLLCLQSPKILKIG
jgi:hypothetical protein